MVTFLGLLVYELVIPQRQFVYWCADRKSRALQNALQAACEAWGECPQPLGMVRTRDQRGRVTPHGSHSLTESSWESRLAGHASGFCSRGSRIESGGFYLPDSPSAGEGAFQGDAFFT